MRRGFWKLAALDVQLSQRVPGESFGSPPAHVPAFLKPPDTSHAARTTVCCLSMHDAGALDYILAAHASPQHALQLDTLFAHAAAKPSAGYAAALRGLVRTLDAPVPVPAVDAPQVDKLACFTEATCEALCAQVGTADVVIGALS